MRSRRPGHRRPPPHHAEIAEPGDYVIHIEAPGLPLIGALVGVILTVPLG